MCAKVGQNGVRPPFQIAWTSSVGLMRAVPAMGALYGVTYGGNVVALNPSTGAVRWTTQGTYVRTRLTVVGNTVYAYKLNDGLAMITDNGTTCTEQVLISINPVNEAAAISNIVVTASNILFTTQEALLVLTLAGRYVAGTEVGSQYPHVVMDLRDNHFAVVDGFGQVQLYTLSPSGLTRTAYTMLPDPGTTRKERPVHLSGGKLICGANGRTVAYDAVAGAIRWTVEGLGAEAIAEAGGNLYLAGASGHIWAVNMADGGVRWRRTYLYGVTGDQVGLVERDGCLFETLYTASGGPIHLLAIDRVSGEFLWQASPARDGYGFVCFHGDTLIPYGTSLPTVGMTRVASPRITADAFAWRPNPLRGNSAAFAGTLTMDLPVRCTLTITAMREREGAGAKLLDNSSRTGHQTIDWNAGGPGGFTDTNQFGRLLIEVAEAGGATYTVAKLIPVNTLPDILGHWAQGAIEAMIYHQYISGYPDLAFRPDNLVSRAETAVIIAKTLDLQGPTPGFQSKLTDIATHWARDAIRALEERQIINGIQEPDGTFTFRPEMSMTRSQEAKVLVRAYQVAAAPAGFRTRFTDIADHWARPDIEALEAAGYVNGIREPDGTYTYRPEQNLSRAELCVLVVRIRRLTH